MFLGRFTNNSPTLTLTTLIPGATYSVGFELYIGATMDGVEPWTLTTGSGQTLVNTTFGNFGSQQYSDTNFTSPTPDVAPKTGADVSQLVGPSNFDDFTIYYFGKGAGNPTLNFVAPASGSQTLIFAGASMPEPTDEFWALDNVTVTTPDQPVVGVPESSEGLAWFALTGLIILSRFWKSIDQKRGAREGEEKVEHWMPQFLDRLGTFGKRARNPRPPTLARGSQVTR